MASAGDRYVRCLERASERTNVTAGGCLRNPLLCYTQRPSIAIEQRTPCPASPRRAPPALIF